METGVPGGESPKVEPAGKFQGGKIIGGGKFLPGSLAEEDLKGGFLGNGRARGKQAKS